MIMKVLCVFILVCLVALASPETTLASANDSPRIARWYQSYAGAVSLRFDDELESHINIAIPLLNDYGFRATFMVNPGLQRYRDHRDFWEQQVPAMGHRLGNHTMHHRGARNIEEANYEIGEASRVIWRAYPQESKLLDFASGGGWRELKWGGKAWSDADPAYRQLMDKYHLIDLFDGKHPYLSVRSDLRTEDLCGRLDRTADEHGHQAFAFHNIGQPSILELIKALYRGYGLTISREVFSGFLKCLAERRDRLWVAPLIDVLKYEEEAKGATIRVLTSTRRSCTLALAVLTDPALYDHKLTMIIPVGQGVTVRSVTQNNEKSQVYQRIPGEFLVDVKPVNSTITVHYNSM